MKVVIDGVEYVPCVEIPEAATDTQLHKALCELVNIQYFGDGVSKDKVCAWAWDALKALSPELAELAGEDPRAAYARLHEGEGE